MAILRRSTVNIHPGLFADRGCWISDDRIYAFISWATSSIGEIGYHGAQPVSRNSRLVVREEGVCSFWIRNPDGSEQQLQFGDVDWTPGCVCVQTASGTERLELTIAAAGRRLIVAFAPALSSGRVFVVRFSTKSLFSDVQGVRTWSHGILTGSRIAFTCRDRIILGDWMKRAGPYAGDFLIPEPLRRTIFIGEGRRPPAGVCTFEHADLRREGDGASGRRRI
jgi:hypothetical protein